MSSWDEVFDNLESAKPAEAWRPENAGDSVVGLVEATGVFTNEYGDSPTVTLKQRNGSSIIVYGFGGGLKKRLNDAALVPGDGLKVTYFGLGDMLDKKGKKVEFKKYEIAVVRNAAGTAASAATPSAPTSAPAPSEPTPEQVKAAKTIDEGELTF